MTYREHRFRSADDRLDLFARDYPGDGPVLLMMHGLTRNSADFEPLVAHLEGRYRLIVPDQRGRGLSQNDPDAANYRPDTYSHDMFTLLSSLEIETANLVGTSMGGLMSMVMVAMQPERFPSIVLNDIGPEIDDAGLGRIAKFVGPRGAMTDWAEAAERTRALNQHALRGLDADDWLAFARRTCRETEAGEIEFAYDPRIADAFAEPEGVAPVDLWPLWNAMSAHPVLLVRGETSDLLSRETVARMEREHAGPFAFVDLPERGHAPILDEPEAVAAITRFLSEHAR
ncbi:alpha/beta hydrolase [Novosphingobium marinum]|uniref:Pimeloyl-ACP methyl ester carboxylesterase n=1 Tax=Novosphingobium marinum TaxID=1514948 RepID=A0A7Z0BWW0_9SPHN|nr:alpha/beta hydrolase [Novosphingobium marinum]NYH96800.1 pimeloyl-ACP methyl ester carboxylesterase [Novosphingobium marinum]GGC40140.1 alpha/beta hydrolase [Novosphingobium marinum]